MTEIGKFSSDVQKLLKHERQNNSGTLSYQKVEKQLRKLFENATTCPGELPGSVFEYWQNTYIYTSSDLGEEPSAEHIQKLSAFLAFLDTSDEDEELITDEDWEELNQLVNYEADELPIETLTGLMQILVSKGTY